MVISFYPRRDPGIFYIYNIEHSVLLNLCLPPSGGFFVDNFFNASSSVALLILLCGKL